MDVTVCVPTFGDEKWKEQAERAIASGEAQGAEVIHWHGVSLAESRNALASMVETEWIVYLDADDELGPGYLEAMAEARADLRAPVVQYVQPGGKARAPYMPKVAGHRHACDPDCLTHGNWMVVGTAVRAEMAREIGWRAFPVYEDWDFFQRCWLAGASIQPVLEAVYVAHVRSDSRNRAPNMAFKNAVHEQIVRANLGDPAAA